MIERHREAFHAFMAVGPFVIGFYPLTGLINPLWGSLLGFPLYVAARGHSVAGPHPMAELLAFFLWPVVVLAGAV